MTATIKEVADVVMGTAPPGSSYNHAGEGLPMIAGAGDYGERYPNPKKWTTQPSAIADPGDLIVCIRATIGDLNWADRRYCLGRGVAAIRPKDGRIDPRFLGHFVEANKAALTRLGTGSTFLAIRRGDLENFEVPLPPLSEQQRIADILDKADAIRRKRWAAFKIVEEYPMSGYYDRFGDPTSNPNGWPTRTVGELLETIIDYRGKTPPKSASGIRCISAANVKDGHVVFEKPVYISESDYKEWTTRGFTAPGDVLITTEAPVGQVARYPETGTYLITRRVMALRPKDGLLDSEFLLHTFMTRSVQRRLERFHHGSTVPRILKPDITGFEIPVPPVDLQRDFRESIRALGQVRTTLQDAAAATTSLFGSLVQRAFRGEL